MDFKDLVGKTLVKVEDGQVGDDVIYLTDSDGNCYCSQHMQDCCESVGIHTVEGDYSNVIGVPLTFASENKQSDGPVTDYEPRDSFTWTHQVLRTDKGEVNIYWLGESNGYYSEVPYFGYSHTAI